MKKGSILKRTLAAAIAVLMLVPLCSCQLLINTYSHGVYTPPEAETEPVEQENDYEMTLELLIEQLNEKRSESDEADYELEDFLPDYTSEDFLADEFTDAEFEMLTTVPTRLPVRISCEQAIEDVEYLFRILRTSYGAYTLMGGDEVFFAARDNLISELSLRYASGIKTSELRQLMLDELVFVEDTHFGIDNINPSFSEKRYYRDRKERVFRYDDTGFYTEIDEERWYVGEEDEAFLMLTIAEDGELVYGLFALDDENEPKNLPTHIELTNADGEEDKLYIDWIMMSCDYVWRDDYYTYEEIDGIPVVSLNTYYLDEDSFSDVNAFINDGEELCGEDVFVIDLRYNTGGYDSVNDMWMYNLTGGDSVDWTVGYAAYISRLNNYIFTNNGEYVDTLFGELDFFDENPDYWEDDSEETESEDESLEVGGTYLIEPESDFYDYDGTIFVLFNKQTYSAGELALFQFENMSNVVFVGMNSNGCLLTGGVNMDAPVYLPNSGLSINYSAILVTSDIMDGFDSYGFQPDIIVDNNDAIEYVIKCWQYYNED